MCQQASSTELVVHFGASSLVFALLESVLLWFFVLLWEVHFTVCTSVIVTQKGVSLRKIESLMLSHIFTTQNTLDDVSNSRDILVTS